MYDVVRHTCRAATVPGQTLAGLSKPAVMVMVIDLHFEHVPSDPT